MREVRDGAYTEASLCFPVIGDRVLLAEKQKKIGAGYLNGFGGKREPQDVSIAATNVREVEEEVGIKVLVANKMGEISFRNPSNDNELRRMVVHIFIATEWLGEPRETDEMKKIGWYDVGALDYQRFLSADRLFLPQILRGECIRGSISYNEDWSVESSDVTEVQGF
jgi:8-oxo-dGTP diphosphatase